MTEYRCLIEKTNELNYKKNVTSKREVIDTLKRLNKYRSTNTINTALFTINYKNKRKMKTLKIPDAFVQSSVREVLQLLEKKVDAIIKNECSLCGAIKTPPLSSTTHGANLPMNFSSAKRWIVLPSGRKGRRLIIEQIGRYEGPRFIPHSAGRHLHWVSNNSTLVSKNCCLLDYLNTLKDFKFIENVSLKLASDKEIDQEEIQAAVFF